MVPSQKTPPGCTASDACDLVSADQVRFRRAAFRVRLSEALLEEAGLLAPWLSREAGVEVQIPAQHLHVALLWLAAGPAPEVGEKVITSPSIESAVRSQAHARLLRHISPAHLGPLLDSINYIGMSNLCRSLAAQISCQIKGRRLRCALRDFQPSGP